MLDLNLNHHRYNIFASTAIETIALQHAADLGHKTVGTDDALLGLLTLSSEDSNSVSPARLFDDHFGMTLGEIIFAVSVVANRREVWSSNGASKGVVRAIRIANKIARQRAGGFWKRYCVTRMDVLAGLIEVNDKTFQGAIAQLETMFEGFGLEQLKHAMESESPAKALVMI